MDRREFMKIGGVTAIELGAARILMSQARPGMPGMAGAQTDAAAQDSSKADFTLRIAPVTVELAPTRIISTIGYNGTSPGPLLRMREGKPVTVDVINETDVPELVHWHGLFIPAEVDGVEEENTPMVPPHGRIRYQFTPRPAGHALVSHAHHGRCGLASGGLHGPVRISNGRDREQPGKLRSGSVPRAPGMGAFFQS